MTDEGRRTILNRYAAEYASVWTEIEQGLSGGDDAYFLMGPSNYFFLTGGRRWAVDPMFNVPRSRASAALIDPERVFSSLDFILLTHDHVDHFDPELIARCPDAGWIVPEHMMNQLPAALHPHLTPVRPGDVIRRGDIVIHAFRSLHYDAGTTIGVEETGYFVEAGGFRILLPGDVREYDAAKIPRFERVTHLFAHVWLGRRNALNWPCGDYPGQMARFALAFGPEHISLGHLLEATREMEDMWTMAHAGLVADELLSLNPAVKVHIPMIGQRNPLR